MATTGHDGSGTRVFRTVPALVIGYGMLAAAAVLAGLSANDLVAGRADSLWSPLALVVGVAVAGWLLFLRPRVVLREDGIEMVNVWRDTDVPFAVVDRVEDRWALEVVDHDGRRHSAWAVPTRRRVVPASRIDRFGETTRRRASEGRSAAGAADDIQRMLQRWRLDGGEAAAAAGTSAQENAPHVTTRLSPVAVAVTAAAALLVVLSLV